MTVNDSVRVSNTVETGVGCSMISPEQPEAVVLFVEDGRLEGRLVLVLVKLSDSVILSVVEEFWEVVYDVSVD